MLNVITDNIDIWISAQKKKKAVGRGSSNKLEFYGIKKLRELILELAIQGKLVTQDRNDEPADKLLNRIAEDKKRLIREGKIKKQKQLPLISNEEKTFKLPAGWEWARFPDIANYNMGKTPATKNPEYWTDGNGIPWVSIADLNHFGTVNETNRNVSLLSAEKVFKSEPIPKGSLLMSFKLTVGKISILDVDAFHNEAIISIQPYSGINKDFLFNFLPTIALKGNTKNVLMGNTLNSKSLSLLTIPIPPLNEQKKIIQKVDELMVLCDQLEQEAIDNKDAHQTLVKTVLNTLTSVETVEAFTQSWQQISEHFDTLFTTEESIEELKQTILQLAVMGKLVPQDPNDEPASTLFKKIEKEKEKLINEGKVKKLKKMSKIKEDELQFILPMNWKWARLQEVIDVRDGTHDSPKDALGEDTYPLVTSKNFSNNNIMFDEARRISKEDHLEITKRSAVEKYDILFAMIGGNIGNQVIVQDDQPFSIKNVALFKYYNKDLTLPFFIKRYMEHLALTLQEKASGGAQPFVSLGTLRNLIIALPPVAEQNRIIEKVEELTNLCDLLKSNIQEAQNLQVILANAIVSKAV